MPEPKGSEPSPRKVCQNATLKRSLSQELDVSAACNARDRTISKTTVTMHLKCPAQLICILHQAEIERGVHHSFIGLPMMISSAL